MRVEAEVIGGPASSLAIDSISQSNMQPPSHKVPRRQSRFDPKGEGDDADDEGYGELGHHHPLRRVSEEGIAKSGVSLPGIQALFGAASTYRLIKSTHAVLTLRSWTCTI